MYSDLRMFDYAKVYGCFMKWSFKKYYYPRSGLLHSGTCVAFCSCAFLMTPWPSQAPQESTWHYCVIYIWEQYRKTEPVIGDKKGSDNLQEFLAAYGEDKEMGLEPDVRCERAWNILNPGTISQWGLFDPHVEVAKNYFHRTVSRMKISTLTQTSAKIQPWHDMWRIHMIRIATQYEEAFYNSLCVEL